ncbi:BRCA1-associated ATM activator 1 isoform X2 [Kryptolebias marmoratus]|uniref:BRCA1-associated ATM activator 1 isoform X2 n=1 Tax=Kryptolebias marmoratus TaxID=37003 RepID=UPI0007F8AFAE|nr:BRCA1-associated ATM activator 1 isoform X2 [Kryptolebias marmoratus]
MDRECVSALPRVCEVLAASGGSLPDDTSLEKLLDWFTELSEAGVSLLEACPCLLGFVSAVVSNDAASEPSVLSFTLKLTGLLAASEDGFKVLQDSVLDRVFDFRHWQAAGLWEDPCIRIGWIQGLRTMLQHSQALDFFVQADFTEPLLQLQTDTSLFVASAASQTLAHVLLLCQSVPSPEGRHRETIPVETDGKYSAVVAGFCDYLKKSLVPKEASQLHGSQQVLKLLAKLLTRAGPPLRDRLLLTVSDPLEELVTTNYSQLTLPLMDVILAAHSSCGGGERVARLLSVMLSARNPADLVHAAAAFLRSSHPDPDNRARSAGVLLLPLDVITGLALLGADSSDQHRSSVMEQLRRKTSCVSMICISLTNVPQVTSTAPDCLPCSPAEIVSAVLSVLRLCSGDSPSSSPGCAEVLRNVTGSGRVQKCALDALSALSSSSGVKVLLVEVFTLLIQYLNSPASDPSVIQKSYQVLVKWVDVCADLSDVTEQLREDLVQVVRKRVCDVRWEVRDSTVEFLGHLAAAPASLASDKEKARNALECLPGGRCATVPLLQEALQDPEGYVRASSVSALALTLAPSWQQGAAPPQQEAEIVTRLLEILSQDTQGFSRRAVIRFFVAWISSCSSPSSCSLLTQSIPSILSRGSADLDWEVKVHTLELAELLLDRASESRRHPYAVTPDRTSTHARAVESDPVSMLNSLVDQGVFSALLSGLVDCDRPVGLKACQLLIRLRDTVCPLLLGDQDVSDALVSGSRASCELPGCGWAREVRRILGTATAPRNVHGADGLGPEDRGEEEEEEPAVRVGVCDALRRLRLDERLAVLAQSSDHVHNSPLSLLQDILTVSRTKTHLDSQLGQEVIVDCY